MTKEEQDKLLEEAKLRYPPGTKFKEVNSNKEYTLKDIEACKKNLHWITNGYLIVKVEEVDYTGIYLYKNFQWAEIISKPEVKEFYNYVKCVKSSGRFKKDQLIQTYKPSNNEFFYYGPDERYSLGGNTLSFIPCDINGNPIKGYSTSDIVIEDYKQSKDKPFYILVTEENKEVLTKFFHSKGKEYNGYYTNWSVLNERYYVYPQLPGSSVWGYPKNSYKENLERFKNYNEISFEQFLELYPKYKEDKPKFEIGKWYKYNNHIGKFKGFSSEGIFQVSEYIYNNTYYSSTSDWGKCLTKELLTDLTEIQQYLPNGHVDKVTTIPEYVECIELPKGWSITKIGTVYRTDNYFNGSYRILYKEGGGQTTEGVEHCFKPSTKEAYDMQNKPKSLVGRYLKALVDKPQHTNFNKNNYVKILRHSYRDDYDIEGGWEYFPTSSTANHWELMPEGFEPNKVEEKWIPKVGEWAVVERLDLCSLGKNNYKLFEIFQIYNIQKSSYHKYKYWLFKTRGKEISLVSCRKAQSHEIPNYANSIDPIKSDEFVLPEKWCILKNKQEVCEWFNKTIDKQYTLNSRNSAFIHYPKVRGSCIYESIQPGYIEITFEQFKKYVLKESFVNTGINSNQMGHENHLSILYPEIINNPCKEIIFENPNYFEGFWKEKQSLKTELELIPIKKLKTFNN